MLNYLWAAIMLTAIVTSFFTGRTEAVSAAAVSGATEGVKFVLELAGVMCFWTGLMAVAEKSRMIKIFSKLLSPVTRILFPDIDQKSAAMDSIVMNMTANMLGMSNAATPLGLAAMKELDKLNRSSKTASNAMCMFAVINTASIQIIPATLIAMRQAAGSASPTEIIVPIWITSLASVLAVVAAAKIFEKGGRKI